MKTTLRRGIDTKVAFMLTHTCLKSRFDSPLNKMRGNLPCTREEAEKVFSENKSIKMERHEDANSTHRYVFVDHDQHGWTRYELFTQRF